MRKTAFFILITSTIIFNGCSGWKEPVSTVTTDMGYKVVLSFGSQGSTAGEIFSKPYQIAMDSEGNMYIVTDGFEDYWIRKYDKNYNFITNLCSAGSGNGQCNDIYNFTIDGDGNIYVLDGGNNRVQKLDKNGNYIFKFGSQGSGDKQFNNPTAIALDSSGNIYVADSGNYRVQKFDKDGNFITKWELQCFDIDLGIESCGDYFTFELSVIAISSDGSVYIVVGPLVQKFDANGNFIKEWRVVDVESEQNIVPASIAADINSNIYVVGSGYYWGNGGSLSPPTRVFKFDKDGNFITKWGTKGSDNGQFDSPSDIIIDSASFIYVADTNNSRIQKFDASGNFISVGKAYGSQEGKFNNPSGVVVDDSGNIYVADTGNNRIQKFDKNGNFVAKWGISGSRNSEFSSPSSIAVGSDGSVYVVDGGNSRIQKFDKDGNFITKWGSKGSGNGQFEIGQSQYAYTSYGSSSLITVDSSNNIYVADTGNKRVQKFDKDGNYITEFGSVGAGDGQFNNGIGAIATDKNDYVYVISDGADNNARMQIFDKDRNFIKKWSPIAGWDGTLDKINGYFYAYSTTTLYKYTLDGTYINSLGTSDGRILLNSRGVAVDKEGYIYVSDYSKNSVIKFSAPK